MDLALAERVALVTGAAGGIGHAVARVLASEGARLVLVDRTAPVVAADGIRSGGGDARALAADVTDEGAVEEAVASTLREFGRIDMVIGCAGISGPVGTMLTGTSRRDWDAVLAVNVTGAFLLLKHALPVLAGSQDAAAVFVASDSALVSAAGMAAYCASKAALLQLVRAASVENPGVRLNAVCPSVVDTPMSRGDLGLPTGFAGVGYPVQTSEEVAAQIAWLCSPLSRAVDATGIVMDFGYTARSGFPA